jgi:hypothetical protein
MEGELTPVNRRKSSLKAPKLVMPEHVNEDLSAAPEAERSDFSTRRR